MHDAKVHEFLGHSPQLPPSIPYNSLAFSDFVKKLEEKKPVIVCGDMNCARHPIDIHSPKTNLRSAGFTQARWGNVFLRQFLLEINA